MPRANTSHTLVQFKIRYSLPLVGRDKPLIVFPSTAQVDDKFCLVIAKSSKNGLQTFHGESGVREQIRCYNDLLRVPSALDLLQQGLFGRTHPLSTSS
jgi:hypothetical protein